MSWNADTDWVDSFLLSLSLTALYRHGLFKTLQPFRNMYFSVTFKIIEKTDFFFFFFVFYSDVIHIFPFLCQFLSFLLFCYG